MSLASIVAYICVLINTFTGLWLELHARYMHIVDDGDATDPTAAFRFDDTLSTHHVIAGHGR